MSTRAPFGGDPPTPDAAVFVISVAAELSGLHPQTLRTYERMGLITPGRTSGGGRRYSYRDIELLRQIAELTSAGIGIEGVRRILDLQRTVEALRARHEELRAELDATREALRQAISGGPGRSGGSGSGAGGGGAGGDRLPVLRPSPPGGAIVVWRRHH